MTARSRSLEGRLILVVEDEFLIAQEMCELLQSKGARVLGPAPSSDTAFTLLNENAIDCALLDVKLEAGNSSDLAIELQRRDIPFLVLTGYVSELVPAPMRDAPLLGKPYAIDKLLEAIVSLLASRASR